MIPRAFLFCAAVGYLPRHFMISAILGLGAASFVISWVATYAMIRIAPRIGFVDKPGHRKIHHQPKPLGGGVAIFLGVAIPLLAVLIGTQMVREAGQYTVYISGVREKRTAMLAGILLAMLGMHLLGLWDDRRAMGPYSKLLIQLGITTALVASFKELRVLQALGTVPSVVLTVFWIAAITNAFNFLDNMDGLSAGIACVASLAFLVTALSIGQFFVAGMLALLIGALLGFLWFNFSPAKIFMGDSGSLLVGFLLGVLTTVTTYLQPGQSWGAGWYAVFAPVIVLAVPLYDLVVVSVIRLARGKSPFVGDTNHFSHRLVARGMSRRTAVLCLYLITAATSVAAIILPHVQSPFAAVLIFVQTILVLGVVALLEQHPLPELER
jgi:UDP-GlcNAc:undecaprenyl-phosphate GlcNAc-1-phosphate transferase